MNDLIMGKSWGDIQAMQQGTYKAPRITGDIEKPKATEADITMLNDLGLEAIKSKGLFGVIDRLTNSGVVQNE